MHPALDPPRIKQAQAGSEMDRGISQEERQGAVNHIEFCAAIYKLQSASGRYWLHEHPKSASSWQLKTMLNLHSLPGIIKIRANKCAFGLTTKRDNERKFAKKPTGSLISSWCIARELDRNSKNHILTTASWEAKRVAQTSTRQNFAKQYAKA